MKTYYFIHKFNDQLNIFILFSLNNSRLFESLFMDFNNIQEKFKIVGFFLSLSVGVIVLIFTYKTELYESPTTCIDLRHHSQYFGFALITEVILILIFSLLHSRVNQDIECVDCFKFLNYSCQFAQIFFLSFMFNDLIKNEGCGPLRILVFAFLITIIAFILIVIIFLMARCFIKLHGENQQN
ncbi:hypothetical protein pb186bvf_017958 [Paramecium bursaria]